VHRPCCVGRPKATDIIPNSSASRRMDRHAWRSTHTSVRYMRKRYREATTSTEKRSGRFVQYRAYLYPKDSSFTSGSTCSRSFPCAARRCTRGGETFRARRIIRCFASGQDPGRHGSAHMKNKIPGMAPRVFGAISLVAAGWLLTIPAPLTAST
jgi:hypothetical protein